MSPPAQICLPLSGLLLVLLRTMWVRLPNIWGSVVAGSVAEDLWPHPAVPPSVPASSYGHPFLVEKPKKEMSVLFIENPLEACNTMAIYRCVISSQ